MVWWYLIGAGFGVLIGYSSAQATWHRRLARYYGGLATFSRRYGLLEREDVEWMVGTYIDPKIGPPLWAEGYGLDRSRE